MKVKLIFKGFRSDDESEGWCVSEEKSFEISDTLESHTAAALKADTIEKYVTMATMYGITGGSVAGGFGFFPTHAMDHFTVEVVDCQEETQASDNKMVACMGEPRTSSRDVDMAKGDPHPYTTSLASEPSGSPYKIVVHSDTPELGLAIARSLVGMVIPSETPETPALLDGMARNVANETAAGKKYATTAAGKNLIPDAKDASSTKESNLDWKDISDETKRTYEFPTGFVSIDDPKLLNVQESSLGGYAHRIITKGGEGVYIPSGWLGVMWSVKPGAPVFKF